MAYHLATASESQRQEPFNERSKATVMTDRSSILCKWCERPFRGRRGGSPQRFCGARCRMLFWSALRRSGERALAEGILTIADIRTGAPAACTLCQRTELPLPLPGTLGGAVPRPLTSRLGFSSKWSATESRGLSGSG